MITPATFKTRFPEFTATDDARIQLFLDDSEAVMNVAYWGEKYDIGIAYLTAHYLTFGTKSEAGSSGSSGPVAGRSVDGTSVSYTNAVPTNEADAYYGSTSYGQRYLALRRTLGAPAYVI